MKWKDLRDALQFLELDPHGIVIECPMAEDIGYIRRFIRQTIGEPDRETNNIMWYDGRYVKIVPILTRYNELKGYRDNQLFYIGWENGTDLVHLEQRGYRIVDDPSRQIRLWQCMGLYPVDMVRALVHDGMGEDLAKEYVGTCAY